VSSSPYRLPLALPRVTRAKGEGALAGVAAGIGKSLGVDATLVRLTFALLVFADGAGIVAYIAGWLALAPEDEPAPSRRRRFLGLAAAALAGILLLRGLGLSDSLVWPVVLGGVGIALARSRSTLRLAAGLALVAGAVVLFIDQNAGGDRDAALESSAVAIALLLLLGPWAWRLAIERDAERTARIRQQERAEMAARVHDSVLQTLALVQREADDPRRVATLARRQERELRAWLYPGPTAERSGLGAAIETAAAEVEALHGVPVEVVRTGDVDVDERTEALVLAAREAMANAAEHSHAEEVSTFVDVGDEEIAIYVRDRGTGFDPGDLPPEAHGIAESIRGRMARAGGSAEIASSDGGTEVELRLRREP
jgi:signal transduction histidine kinase